MRDIHHPSLITAVQRNDIASVDALLKAGCTPDERDSQQYTPLFYAAMAGNKPIVEKLVTAGADFYAVDPFHANALVLAAVNGHLNVVDYLILAGFDPNHFNHNPFANALLQAAHAGREDIALHLIERGADTRCRWEDNISLLTIAAAQGMSKLIEKVHPLTGMDDDALVHAIIQRRCDAVDQLLTLGANPDTTTRRGESMLYMIASRTPDAAGSDMLIAQKLIDHGANPAVQAHGDTTSAIERAALKKNHALSAVFNQKTLATKNSPHGVMVNGISKPIKLFKKMKIRPR